GQPSGQLAGGSPSLWPASSASAGGLAVLGAAGCGVRSDSLATTIVIAAASTARPASWPPMRRGSSGSADEAWEALVTLPASLCGSLADDEEVGVTVGNRPPR